MASSTDASYLYQFRLILIGQSTVGKSSILRQFKEGEYFPDISLTVGVDFHAKMIRVNGQSIKMQLWDTAGQDRFRAIVKAYYRNAVGGLLVFDITNRESFNSLDEWYDEVMKIADPHKPVFVLVGNKDDQTKQRQVPREDGLRFARNHGMDYIEASAKSGHNVEEAFEILAEKILTMVEHGQIKVEDGWDGIKRGESLETKKRGFPKSGSSSTTVTLDPTTGPPGQNKKCCAKQ
jgi:small GTP-binding protein